jgi:hypothetical protein
MPDLTVTLAQPWVIPSIDRSRKLNSWIAARPAEVRPRGVIIVISD